MLKNTDTIIQNQTSLVELYLAYCQYEKRLANRSLEIYKSDLLYLEQFCQEQNCAIETINSHQIRTCLGQLRLTGLKASTLTLTLSSWRGFFNWLTRFHQLLHNPTLGIKTPQQAQRLPKALSLDDVTQLLQAEITEDDIWLETRDKAIVELLYGSGLRVSELCALDTHQHSQAKAWVDLEQALVFVKGKGGKERIVPMGSYSKVAILNWLKLRSEKKLSKTTKKNEVSMHLMALFIGQRGSRLTPQSIWQRLKRRAVSTQMNQSVHPHMLRHSFASHILQSSQDIRAVQELLGHSSISTTQIYTKLDFQHLAHIYDASHPRAKK
jgi:integrase/recombinase XerC